MNDEKRRRARELMKLYYGGIVETENKIVPPELETVSISGTTLNFNTDVVRPLNSLILHVEPRQSGSGTPSPSNIRPISGYDAVNVYRSGEDTSNPTTYSISLSSAGTVYGGTLNVTSGELVVTWKATTVGSFNWSYNSAGYFYVNTRGDKAYGNFNIKSDTYATTTSTTVSSMGDGQLKGGASDAVIYIKDSRYTTAASFKTDMTNVQLVYELATPITYQLTPTEVTTLLGENTIWMDAEGTIESEYWRIKQ